MFYNETFPKQRLTYKEKTKDNNKWTKDMVDTIIATSTPGATARAQDYERKLSNYLLYNNVLSQRDFERECNPLGIDVGQFRDEIQPYNKTYNKIQVLLGEELKRPFDFRTFLVNSEAVQAKLEHKNHMLKQYMQKEVADLIQSLLGEQPTEEQQLQEYQQMANEIVPPDKLDQYMASYRTRHELKANQILQYLIKSQHLKEKMNDGFKHGLITGEEFVWIGIVNGDPVCKVLNPLGMFYHKSADTKYIHEGSYAGYRTYMTISDILDTFELSDEDVKKLENEIAPGFGVRDDIISKQMKYHHDDIFDVMMRQHQHRSPYEGLHETFKMSEVEVCHVEWISQKKVGFITYTDPETGDEITDMVSEEFPIPSYAESKKEKRDHGGFVTVYYFDEMTLEWMWIDEVWEGVRIGSDIYTNLGPREFQYRSLANPKKVFLSYHGLVYNSSNAPSVSLMDRMKPFQYLYFVVMHKLKRLIAHDQGKVFHFDVSMVDPAIGLEKTMYYIKEMGIDFFNPLQNAEMPGSHQRGKIADATDMSNMQFISNYIQILDTLDFQISEVAGITRQREGFVTAHEAVTNAQQNILQSSTITEAVYFAPHYKLWEHILNSLILCATEAWRKNRVLRQLILDDGTNALLDIEPGEFDNADFGVFLTNSQVENDLFNTLKSLAQPLLQNDKASFSDIIAIYKSTSASEIETRIKESEEKSYQRQMEQIQAQQEAQREQIQAQQQMMEAQQQFQMELQAMKDEAAMERELVKAAANAQANQMGNESQTDGNEINTELEENFITKRIDKLDSDIYVQEAELELKRQKLKQDKELASKDNKTKMQIAKMRPKPTSTKK